MSEIIVKQMNNDEIRDFCIKKDLEIARLNSIIKEVREYIKKGIYSVDGSYVLKILDKVDKE